MSVNYTEAKRIVDATFASATEMGIKIAIAVLDERGDTVIQARMDGAKWWWVDTCRAKAFASALWGIPSGDLIPRATGGVPQAMLGMHGGRLAFAQGALPIVRDGEIIGSVGVGGGTSQQDEDAARAGIATL
jgi:glc operon protein GlcG